MLMNQRISQSTTLLVVWLCSASAAWASSTEWHFRCGAEGKSKAKDVVSLSAVSLYSDGKGAGFDLAPPPVVRDGACVSDKAFFLSIAVPDGSYQVTVELGNDASSSVTTVKAESRRLMLSNLAAEARQTVTRSFFVSVRTPHIEGGKEVHLKPREIGSLDWDSKLTLEFLGKSPSVRTISVKKVDDVPTVYLAGDSTVVDQDKEPWAAWGQMLPRFFNETVAISNQAESGETIRSFETENRFAKIASTIKAGDYLFMQFAHNDQKPGNGFVSIPDYKGLLLKYIELTRAKGATPVLVTSMNRRNFDAQGKIVMTLGDYPETTREVAKEQKLALIDLNAMSKTLYETMGPEGTLKAFVHFPANTFPDQPEELKDNTHFTDYGAYELARCVVKGIRESGLPLASALLRDETGFDPAKPDDPAGLALPQDPQVSTATPYGR
jgi:lysophospholipase L1-like esterase